MVPVCPNCHAMLHRGKTVLSVDELRVILQEAPANTGLQPTAAREIIWRRRG
jgi:hypothetical protein